MPVSHLARRTESAGLENRCGAAQARGRWPELPRSEVPIVQGPCDIGVVGTATESTSTVDRGTVPPSWEHQLFSRHDVGKCCDDRCHPGQEDRVAGLRIIPTSHEVGDFDLAQLAQRQERSAWKDPGSQPRLLSSGKVPEDNTCCRVGRGARHCINARSAGSPGWGVDVGISRIARFRRDSPLTATAEVRRVQFLYWISPLATRRFVGPAEPRSQPTGPTAHRCAPACGGAEVFSSAWRHHDARPLPARDAGARGDHLARRVDQLRCAAVRRRARG